MKTCSVLLASRWLTVLLKVWFLISLWEWRSGRWSRCSRYLMIIRSPSVFIAAQKWSTGCWPIPGSCPQAHLETEEMDFYFTDTRQDFQYLAFELYLNDEYQGYVTFQLSQIAGQRVLKLLDHALLEETWLLPIALQKSQEHSGSYFGNW